MSTRIVITALKYMDRSCAARAVLFVKPFVCESADLGYLMAMFSQISVADHGEVEEVSQGMPPAKTARVKDGGEPRPWLRVFEACLAKMLNAYGMSKVATLPDDIIWDALTQPHSSGAMYGTELASETPERGRVGTGPFPPSWSIALC